MVAKVQVEHTVAAEQVRRNDRLLSVEPKRLSYRGLQRTFTFLQFPPTNEKIGREGREIELKTKVADYAEQVNISAVFSNVTLTIWNTSPLFA